MSEFKDVAIIKKANMLEKEMQLVRSGNMHRYDHDSLGNKIKENFADVPGSAAEEIQTFIDDLTERGFVGSELDSAV